MSELVIPTVVLTLVRGALFQFCRVYLLRSLVHDLKGLSTVSTTQSNSDGDDDDDGESMPHPISSPRRPSRRPADLRGQHALTAVPFHSRVSRAAFALSFSESCLLFILVGMQSLGVSSDAARLLNWHISLSVLLCLILLAIPLLQCLFVTYRTGKGKLFQKRHLVALLPYGIYIYLLALIPVPTSSSSSDNSWTASHLSTLPALSRLTVLGVLILGVLSGFGAMRNAWAVLTKTSKGATRGIAGDSDHAELSLARVRSDLADRRRKLASTVQGNSTQASGSWMSRVFSGGDELSSLRQEISGLQALEYEMSRNVERMRTKRAQVVYSRTIPGRVWGIVEFGLGVYCVYRILAAVVNFLIPSRGTIEEQRSTPSDIFIHWLLATFPSLDERLGLTPTQVVSLSRQFSLVMVGLIVLSSVRLVLRGVHRLLRMTSKSVGASFMLLILSQLMGTYFLSTLIQLRSSFPPPSASSTPSLFTTLPSFEVFGPLFDTAFLLAAIGSLAYRVIGNDEWEMVGR